MSFQNNIDTDYRRILKDQFASNKFDEVDLFFEDEDIQLTDCCLFESQIEQLKQLTLTFAGSSSFNEETLGAIKYIKLVNLEDLSINFSRI